MRAIRKSSKNPKLKYTARFQSHSTRLSPPFIKAAKPSGDRRIDVLETTEQCKKRRQQKIERFKVPVPTLFKDGNGTRWNRDRMLGKGGFARVFRVLMEPAIRGKVNEIALKCVNVTMLTAKQLGHWGTELQISRCVRHKHVVDFIGSFKYGDFGCLKMMLCQKQTLMELVWRRKRINEGEVTYFMRQAAAGLHYLHQNRIMHRDIKLGNLFLDSRMQVRIGDFGLAKMFPPGKKEIASTVCGTPNYMAPEILRRDKYSYAVDVWSLGCVMYALLNGKPPFQSISVKTTYRQIMDGQFKISVDWSETLVALLDAMLHKDPAKRVGSGALLKHPFFADSVYLNPDVLPSTVHYVEYPLTKLRK